VGSVSFTDGERHHTMLEVDVSEVESDRLNATPEKMYSLLESYFEAVSMSQRTIGRCH